MSSFSAIKLSRPAFLMANRKLAIAAVVTCLAAGPLFAATPATSESLKRLPLHQTLREPTRHRGGNIPWYTKSIREVSRTRMAMALVTSMESSSASVICKVWE